MERSVIDNKFLVAGIIVLLLVGALYYGYTRFFGFGAGDYTEFTMQAEPYNNEENTTEEYNVTIIESSELSQRERSILNEAIQSRYRVRKHRYYGRIPAAFDGVLAACGLPDREELARGHFSEARSLIRYNDTLYRVTVRQKDTYA